MTTKKENTGYYYDRTNSKGEKIFRRNTNETLEDAEKYLTDNNIYYESRPSGSMMYIETHRRFAYYPTTGRWSVHPFRNKHYKSNGIEDFITRFGTKKYESKTISKRHS